jgi:hypothetical protein
MQYAYLENGRWVGPVAMRSRFNNVGGWHAMTDEQRAMYRWYPLIVENDTFDMRKQTRTPLKDWRLVDGVVYANYDVFNKPLSQVVAERCAQVTLTREQKLWNNIPYTFPGSDEVDAIQMRNPTDQNNLTSVVMHATILYADGIVEPSIEWNTANNRLIMLTPQQMIDVGIFVKNRFTNIYKTSWQHKAAIRAMQDLDDIINYDIDKDWPD